MGDQELLNYIEKVYGSKARAKLEKDKVLTLDEANSLVEEGSIMWTLGYRIYNTELFDNTSINFNDK